MPAAAQSRGIRPAQRPATSSGPLVSIVISNFNYAEFLAIAIDSALAQTYREFEVIVVDDGSTDHSAEVIDRYADRVTAVFKPNGGQASAFNTGVEHSQGELVCLLDADDVFEPDKVRRVVAAAIAHPEAHLIHHRMRMVDESGCPMHAPFPRCLPHGDVRAESQRTGGWILSSLSSALTFRRAYLDRVCPIPLHHSGRNPDGRALRVYPDTYLSMPAGLLAPVAAVPAPLSLYRVHGDNASRKIRRRGSDDPHLISQLAIHEAEVATARRLLHDVFDQQVSLTVEDHLGYQMARHAMGHITTREIVGRVMKTSSLPFTVRVRETVCVLAGRR